MKKAGLFFLLLLLSGCNIRVLNPASDTAEKLTDLIYLSFGLMMLVFVIVMILFVHFLRKFRETKETSNVIPDDENENKWLELTWTVLPFVLLAVLAVPTVKATYDLTSQVSGSGEEAQGEGMVVEVVGQQYNWRFTYENGTTSVDELVLPVGREVEFHLNSKDVIHSFWIPNLAGKIDVFPGKETRLSFQPSDTGTFQGKCAEFCGAEHTLMRFETRVVSEAEFEQWLREQ
ncbi:cytochrome c oxidase subunit II [Halobacillus mangrovi]|uniref:cytochrome c oxidase subunit II n=1 Tax=Halobacillus mangrovi TaxID=402384 RepID=UPI003D9821C1